MNCGQVQRRLPGYMDGAVRASDRVHVREHLDSCSDCRRELERYHTLAMNLGRVKPAQPPRHLASRIRERVSQVRARQQQHARFRNRIWLVFENILEPLAVPATGGLVTALLVFVLVGQSLLAGVPLGAVPNDLPTSLLQPARLESLAPFPVPGMSSRSGHPSSDILLVVATLDSRGGVVRYEILSGPDDSAVRRQLDQVLLFSRFRPQMSFGRPTAGGQVLLSFSEVRVRG